METGTTSKTCTKVHACVLSCCHCVWLFETPLTIACQVPLSMIFSRQEYCCGLSCPRPGGLPHPGIKPVSWSPALAGGFFTTCATWKAPKQWYLDQLLINPRGAGCWKCHRGHGRKKICNSQQGWNLWENLHCSCCNNTLTSCICYIKVKMKMLVVSNSSWLHGL